MTEILEFYAKQFLKLRQGHSKGMGPAPHKPILIISIIELIQKGHITTNKISINHEIVLAFKNNWKKLVHTKHIENFALPFFHLKNEPFWRLASLGNLNKITTKSKSIKSFKGLKENILFAEIDRDLFNLLLQPTTSNILLNVLLDNYFIETKDLYFINSFDDIQSHLEFEILNEPKASYQSNILELKHTLNEEAFEEEVFVRGGMFKKTIPKIYKYTCCISGMHIKTDKNIQMVDACHIIPFSFSNDDTIQNGISLSPNLHRAFDRGLITINQDFIVRVSPLVQESKSTYSISQFEGQQITLPEQQNWYPSLESLIWHKKETYLI